MAGKWKHRFVSAVADEGSATEVGPVEWNDSLVASEGVNGEVATRDSGEADGWKWAAPSAVPRSYLAGLGLANNGADANNDVDIAVGVARAASDDETLTLASALTKRLDAAWGAGTNQGGLDTGAKAASTWYHVWAIKDPSSGVVDALFSLSATAPTMPSGYTKKRRIGAIKTDGSSNILAFTHAGDLVQWATVPLDVDTLTPGTTAVLRTLSVPTGLSVVAIVNVVAKTLYVQLSDPAVTDQAPSATAAPLASHGSGIAGTTAGQAIVRTNTSAQIRTRASSSDDLRIATVGWYDRRGRDD
jgi:hypothetical protein